MRHEVLMSARPGIPSRVPAAGLHAGHMHTFHAELSRRRFLAAAGATVVGAAVGSGLVSSSPARADGPGIGTVLPIPTTVEFIPGSGVFSHVLAPPFLLDENSDPATVFNFEGACGISFTSGTCVRRNRRTNESQPLPFSFNDMRFMKGKYRGRDGHVRNATFAFV